MPRKINTIDLFAGCGGLLDGFMQEGGYNTLACVEWDYYPCLTLSNRLEKKWHHDQTSREVIRFDIQRTEELICGFNDVEYGQHEGLDSVIDGKKVDVVIGGPPCQAYSLAGRIRDPNGMRDDYRNYLFESYISILNHYRPDFFVFENVVGMLSAAPDGFPIVEKIRRAFNQANYCVIDDFQKALYDVADFGVPQHRHRVIILGVNADVFGEHSNTVLDDFYNDFLEGIRMKAKRVTVKEAIFDLPKIYPSEEIVKIGGKKYSHLPAESDVIANHIPRFHSKRDQDVFKMLCEDIQSGRNEYVSTEKLKELYTRVTGKKSNIHKYYVLRWNEQSNTIPAHLFKDGMRHIHPDPMQARSITPREAARLQTFADDFVFLGPLMAQYKMIGNAVPSKFAKVIARALHRVIDKYPTK